MGRTITGLFTPGHWDSVIIFMLHSGIISPVRHLLFRQDRAIPRYGCGILPAQRIKLWRHITKAAAEKLMHISLHLMDTQVLCTANGQMGWQIFLIKHGTTSKYGLTQAHWETPTRGLEQP